MPLKVITPCGSCVQMHSGADFERYFQVRYAEGIEYIHPHVQEQLHKRYLKAQRKGWISSRQKWLGHYYAHGIDGEIPLDLTIQWINAQVGYGVFTNREIPSSSYLGEYGGIVRKRHLWTRWENLYCFEYGIGEGRRSSFVIDAKTVGNHSRFMNHSDCPNAETVSVDYKGCIHVILRTTRRVLEGEQLCYHYGDEYWRKRGKPLDLITPVCTHKGV